MDVSFRNSKPYEQPSYGMSDKEWHAYNIPPRQKTADQQYEYSPYDKHLQTNFKATQPISTNLDHSIRRLKTQPKMHQHQDASQQMVRPFHLNSASKKRCDRQKNADQRQLVNPEESLRQVKQPEYIWRPIKFTGQSRYKEDYQDDKLMHKIRLLNCEKNRQRQSQLPCKNRVSTENDTTYRSKYRPFKIKVIQPTKNSGVVLPPIKFEGLSSYKDHYRGYSFGEIRDPRCPVVGLNVPVKNYSCNRHLYYDDSTKTFK